MPFQHMRCHFSYEGDDVAQDGIHDPKARIGVRGLFMVGRPRIAEAEIIEVVGLTDLEYRAIIWTTDASTPGQRVTVVAKGLDEARKKLEGQYGNGTVFDLHNEEDASRPR